MKKTVRKKWQDLANESEQKLKKLKNADKTD